MLHPSYTGLINTVSKGVKPGEELVVQGRYSIAIVTARRARQIIVSKEPMVPDNGKKPLSIAVEELYELKVKIVNDEDPSEEESN